jgi:hypothetical protein
MDDSPFKAEEEKAVSKENGYDYNVDDSDQWGEKLLYENERLRKALVEIRKLRAGCDQPCIPPESCPFCIADEALKP